MSVRVIRPGLFTTIQDGGRFGWQAQGVGPGGAMDLNAMRQANALVGNHESAAVLECTLVGPTLRFEEAAIVALSGAPADARIGDAPIPNRRAVFLPGGMELNVGPCTSGCRTTLAVAGGLAVVPVLGSRSTNVLARFGGLDGRALVANDLLPVGPFSNETLKLFARLRTDGPQWQGDSHRWSDDPAPRTRSGVNLRVVPAATLARIDQGSRAALFSQSFRVGQQSDRMGYRLEGPPLALTERQEAISEGVAWGAVQLPPDGQLIVLGADRQTTGGYPVIAHVASVDRSVMAQLRPGDSFGFTPMDLASAEEAWLASERRLTMAIDALRHQRA